MQGYRQGTQGCPTDSPNWENAESLGKSGGLDVTRQSTADESCTRKEATRTAEVSTQVLSKVPITACVWRDHRGGGRITQKDSREQYRCSKGLEIEFLLPSVKPANFTVRRTLRKILRKAGPQPWDQAALTLLTVLLHLIHLRSRIWKKQFQVT